MPLKHDSQNCELAIGRSRGSCRRQERGAQCGGRNGAGAARL